MLRKGILLRKSSRDSRKEKISSSRSRMRNWRSIRWEYSSRLRERRSWSITIPQFQVILRMFSPSLMLRPRQLPWRRGISLITGMNFPRLLIIMEVFSTRMPEKLFHNGRWDEIVCKIHKERELPLTWADTVFIYSILIQSKDSFFWYVYFLNEKLINLQKQQNFLFTIFLFIETYKHSIRFMFLYHLYLWDIFRIKRIKTREIEGSFWMIEHFSWCIKWHFIGIYKVHYLLAWKTNINREYEFICLFKVLVLALSIKLR